MLTSFNFYMKLLKAMEVQKRNVSGTSHVSLWEYSTDVELASTELGKGT